MYPCRQSFLVFGLSKSGQATAEFLLEQKARVYIYDDLINDRVEETSKLLVEKGAIRIFQAQIATAYDFCDILVLSPGVPIDHPISVAFKKHNKAVIGEAELAARILRCPIVAVTGTNGKTTTVSMIEAVLNKSGFPAKACGNIGTPLLSMRKEHKETIAVAEISSFQLETLNSLRPHISVVLNITEDHLNRHYNMENYIFLKTKIFKNCTESEFVILNYDDANVRAIANKTKANVLFFSVRERVRGAYYEDGELYFGKEKIMSADDLSIGGMHNIQNALVVIIAAKIMGVKSKDISMALSEFKGIKHRIEEIGTINGVTFIDDSKGTNVDATLTAIAAMKEETVLLLGGQNKGYDYRKLFSSLTNSKVVHTVLYGENRFALLKNARECKFDKISLCDNFQFAVQIAFLKAKNRQNILLSPASASFDEFTGYEERGNKFVEIFQWLQQRENLWMNRQVGLADNGEYDLQIEHEEGECEEEIALENKEEIVAQNADEWAGVAIEPNNDEEKDTYIAIDSNVTIAGREATKTE